MLKTSERLYELNSKISLYFIGLKKIPTTENMMEINKELGEIIKEIRKLEEK